MKKLNLLFLFVSISIGISAQTINLNDPLPTDTRFKKGVLENGMTYYLHSTDVTKDVASYYIIQNVGSILENEDQRGLAHFLEHMAFNGTENFNGKEFLNTMQERGLVFGRDINAYTSFDETVYNVNNVPTTPEMTKIGLQILHDWSNYLLLTDEEIDSERGVIKEEWRTRQSGGMRVLEKTFPVRFNNSKYAYRFPIGLMSVVDNFEYKALRDFYHDWYRTDLQAIAIVGDFDVAEMEKKIIAKFSEIPAVENPLKRKMVRIPDNEELMFVMAMDEEVATSTISFNIRHDKSLEDQTVGDLKEGLIDMMINSMISTRINELSQNPEATFLWAGISYRDAWAVLHKEFGVSIGPKPDQQHAAFKEVLTEVIRATNFGFTKAEIDRTIIQLSSYYENKIAKIDDVSHASIIRTIQSNYLENAHMTDIVKEFELVKVIFDELKAEEIQARLQEMYAQKNRYITVTGVEGRKNLTKEDALAIILSVENDASIEAYAEESGDKSLMDGVNLTVGKIVSTEKNEKIEATTFTLSNGIKVHYKFVDKNKDDVKLQAISDGGKSLIDPADFASNEFVENVIQMSGLGEFSSTDLPKLLAGKTANSSFSIGEITEGISGSSNTKDVETMLQLVNLRFTHPRFDESSYKVFMQQLDSYLIRKGADIKSKISDSLTVTLYGNNNPKNRILTKEYVSEVSFETMKNIYNNRFANAADFEFFIVGDVKQEDLTPLLEQYIASIPTDESRENWKDNKAQWIQKNTDKDIYLVMENPKATVRFAVKNEMKYSLKNAQLMKTLGDVLQLRFTETLREEEGGTYGARSWGSLSKEPKEQGYLSISFDCNPDKVDDLVKIVNDEVQAIADGKIQQVDLDKTLKSYLKGREEAKNYNNYEMALLKNYVLEGYNMNDSANFEDIVNAITVKDLQKIAKKLLKSSSSFEIVFKPKM
ncbi:MAG: insulinase family protein [Flavobacteriaceae bacterium]|nr:insulinase family protein [Flavobacteriaceae bacterium]